MAQGIVKWFNVSMLTLHGRPEISDRIQVERLI